MTPELSIVVPVYNESESIAPLLAEIGATLGSSSYEIVCVDDGSVDGSAAVIEKLASANPKMTAVFLSRNFGQTAALAAGFKECRGEIIVPMDGDGQNDPRDIPRLIQKIQEGYDVVSGWRQNRQDPLFSKRIPSLMANFVISRVTRVQLHDFGCTLKAYRRSSLEGLRLYGEMHRFLPAWCAWRGARIAELVVNHRPRLKGNSKYGIGRTFNVFLDLLSTRFISGYLTKPSYVFGAVALLLYVMGVICTALVFYDKLGPDRFGPLRVPGLLLASFLGIVGTLLLMLGLLAELIVRLYYEVADQNPYQIRRILKNP